MKLSGYRVINRGIEGGGLSILNPKGRKNGQGPKLVINLSTQTRVWYYFK